MAKSDEEQKTASKTTVDPRKPLTDTARGAESLLLGRLSQEAIDARLRDDLQDMLLAYSLGIEPSSAALHRYIPIEVYIPGDPEEIDFDFLDVVMRLLEFGDLVGWKLHMAGPVEQSSLRVAAIFRTLKKLTGRETQEEIDGLKHDLVDALSDEHQTVHEQEPNGPHPARTQMRPHVLGKFRKAIAESGLLVAFLAAPAGSYIQVGTYRLEVEAQASVAVKHVPASDVVFAMHLGAKAPSPGDSENPKPR